MPKKTTKSSPSGESSARRPSKRSLAEEHLHEALLAEPLPGWDLTREHVFHAERKWSFDFAFPSVKLAVEVDGAGHHRSYAIVRRDTEKLNTAALLGWRVLRFQSSESRKAAEWAAFIREALVTPV
jgi:very-short-patch-repair endonuclease